MSNIGTGEGLPTRGGVEDRPTTKDGRTNWQLGIEVGEALIGTCIHMSQMLDDMDLPSDLDDNSDFCTALDNTTLCCEGCSWWCEPSEMTEGDDMLCEDCSKGASDDE